MVLFWQEDLTSHRAVLVISAHWEERVVTVQTTPQPDLYYDYYGFPPETYQLYWPAKGDPQLASQTRDLLEARGIKCSTNEKRGYDHGVFVPLMLMFPVPKVPGQFLFARFVKLIRFGYKLWKDLCHMYVPTKESGLSCLVNTSVVTVRFIMHW